MGPLTELGILNHEGGILMAFIIGIAFGFILEQAGFSSTRKLAGVFYGYDFVVIKVFFTAAITGATGLVLMNYFEVIDLKLIYVNRFFPPSAIVGAAIMGAGFIIGGFCPGTSVCAAAIGKIDAMAFIGGILLGIIIFAETFPLFKGFFTANPKGNMKITEVLGIKDGLFVLFFILIALGAFATVHFIQKKVKKVEY